jgi:4-cresol dehydrogenase (hydroxylating)
MAIVAPSLGEAQFARAVAACTAVVGAENVHVTEPALEAYLDVYALDAGDGAYVASAAIRPGSTDEVRAIVRIANEHHITLWPISLGKNMSYGSAAPRTGGSFVLDLSRMNRVLEVNEKYGYALIEPGVSFFDLNNHLRAAGYDLWTSSPGRGWGSVLGNALERGLGYTPYGDHSAQVCGMEVVMPDGDLVRTGMGAMPESPMWNLYKGGFGPSFEGMFMQSNYGIVTKIGIWLMPAPEMYYGCWLSLENESDLGPFVDAVRPLRMDGTIPNPCRMSNSLMNAPILSLSKYYEGSGPLPADALARLVKDVGVGYWRIPFAVYGDEAVAEHNFQKASRAFRAAMPDVRIEVTKYARGATIANELDWSQAGIPRLPEYHVLQWPGAGGAHTNFSPVSPPSGADAEKQYRMAKSRYAEYGFNYLGGFIVGVRHLNHIAFVLFDKFNAEERSRVRALMRHLIADFAAEGYGEYRTHLEFMDDVANTYSFNHHAQMRLAERVKDALDPNGILAPGKQGIWPAGPGTPRSTRVVTDATVRSRHDG